MKRTALFGLVLVFSLGFFPGCFPSGRSTVVVRQSQPVEPLYRVMVRGARGETMQIDLRAPNQREASYRARNIARERGLVNPRVTRVVLLERGGSHVPSRTGTPDDPNRPGMPLR
jgi:hypothetical protein